MVIGNLMFCGRHDSVQCLVWTCPPSLGFVSCKFKHGFAAFVAKEKERKSFQTDPCRIWSLLVTDYNWSLPYAFIPALTSLIPTTVFSPKGLSFTSNALQFVYLPLKKDRRKTCYILGYF
ncbi:unnamed protein product [Sphenostylis stenocarpa]|uniref:Uncharacterized protein n=1 Tax=Sphenostylis stenocarpa TaxID=92480 RepID=A0AA86S691_9FABA|nr:unnamed protein product [Sphenostylis stenocarpa]